MISLCIWLIVVKMAQAIVVQGPRGPFAVAHEVRTLVDHTRWDPYAEPLKPHKRRILVSVFSPIGSDDIDCEVEIIPYLPPATAEIHVGILESLGLPGFLLQGFELEFCKTSTRSKSLYPTIIFSPGFSTSRLLTGAQASSLARQGYNVITVDHPYEATIVEFPNGDITYGFNRSDASDAIGEKAVRVGNANHSCPFGLQNNSALATQVRVADVSFLIDSLPWLLGSPCNHLNQNRVFIYGHSLGGATAASAVYQDNRVLGGLNFDGTIYGSVAEEGLEKPFILAGTPVPPDSTSEPFFGFYQKLRGPNMLLTISGTTHFSFFDAPFLLSLRNDVDPGQIPWIESVLGSIDGLQLATAMDELLGATARYIFTDDSQGLCTIDERLEEIAVLEKDLPC